MRSALELHDSRVSHIELVDGVATIYFSHGYIHKSRGTPARDPGTGWSQELRLVMWTARASGQLPTRPSTVAEGFLEVGGIRHELIPLPWRLVRNVPLFDNVIPGRFALYVALIAALVAAVWAASPETSRKLRIVLTGAAALALVPALWHGYWHEHPSRPAFFGEKLDRRCLKAGDSVLVLPPPFQNSALLWQAESGFRFGLADGALNDAVPGRLPHRDTMLQIVDDNVPPGGAKAVLAAALAQGVDAILVDPVGGRQWTGVLDRVLRGRRIGGMTLYRLDGVPCRGT
jgi:hypothetical protein